MAKTLETFPAAGSHAKYPWDEWLDGQIWALEKGSDFDSRTQTLRSNAQLQARKRGGRAKSRRLTEGESETVVLQFVRD